MIKKKIIQKKILKRIHYFISFKSYYKKKLFLLKYLKSSLMVYLNLKFKFPYKFDLTNQVTIFLLIQFFFLYYNNFLLAEEVSLETINEIAKEAAKDSIIEITGKFKEELIKNIIESSKKGAKEALREVSNLIPQESTKKIAKEGFVEITPELERKIIKNIIEGAEEGAKQALRERSKLIPEEIIKEAIKEGIEEAVEELKAEKKKTIIINSIIFYNLLAISVCLYFYNIL
jgi:hypothetical protein